MPKKKTSVDKPRSESAQTTPENDEIVVEFAFGGEQPPEKPIPQAESAKPLAAAGKKAKKRSVFFKFTNNPG